jgi:3-hydroxy acid dehydrogenase/malonic semialdehyde reductase
MNKDHPKLVIITGATSGFGKASAIKFATNGWKVIATGRRLDRLKILQAHIGDDLCEISCFDITDVDATKAFCESVRDRNVDLLVNNAGLALGLSPAYEADLQDWETMIETNILALTRITRAILPQMVKNKSGHIINLGSIAGTYPYPGANVYGATKAFVEQFSLNLRADLGGTGVRVTNIEPGLANTEFSKVRFHGDETKADSIYQDLEPLIAEDIAESIFWCATQPKHVNINRLEVMPTCQAFGPLSVEKN